MGAVPAVVGLELVCSLHERARVIADLLQKTELEHLRSLVSPTFFDVVPSRMLWREGKGLVRNYRDRDGFADAMEERRRTLGDADMPIRLDDGGPRKADPVEAVEDYAEHVVALYFHQIWFGNRAIIDLRASAVSEDRSDGYRLLWHPGPMWMEHDETFRGHLKDVYQGFYTDDAERFEAGLSALGMGGASDLFARHFGENVEATRFELDRFIETFHDIFVFCRERDIELAGEFLSLGVYLATMYENLDRFDVTVDARRAFERGTSNPPEEG